MYTIAPVHLLYEHISSLTLSLLMSYIYGAAANASKWQMGFNSAFKGLNSLTQCTHTWNYWHIYFGEMVCDREKLSPVLDSAPQKSITLVKIFKKVFNNCKNAGLHNFSTLILKKNLSYITWSQKKFIFAASRYIYNTKITYDDKHNNKFRCSLPSNTSDMKRKKTLLLLAYARKYITVFSTSVN
jgi:hypothetical protein